MTPDETRDVVEAVALLDRWAAEHGIDGWVAWSTPLTDEQVAADTQPPRDGIIGFAVVPSPFQPDQHPSYGPSPYGPEHDDVLLGIDLTLKVRAESAPPGAALVWHIRRREETS